MKNKTGTIVILAMVMSVVVYSFIGLQFPQASNASSSGSPGGRSNSPGDGSSSCIACHSGAALNAGSATAIIGSTGFPVGGYVPGQTYTITAGISGTSSSKIGFEATAEKDADNSKVGTYIITDASRTKSLTNSVTHISLGTVALSGANAWSFDWTAPSAGTGDVTFYAAFNVTNSNFSTSGDSIYTASFSVAEDLTVSINELELKHNFTIYPNPAKDFVYLTPLAKSVEVYSLTGKNVMSGKLVNGQLNIQSLSQGVYFVKALINGQLQTKKLIVQ